MFGHSGGNSEKVQRFWCLSENAGLDNVLTLLQQGATWCEVPAVTDNTTRVSPTIIANNSGIPPWGSNTTNVEEYFLLQRRTKSLSHFSILQE